MVMVLVISGCVTTSQPKNKIDSRGIISGTPPETTKIYRENDKLVFGGEKSSLENIFFTTSRGTSFSIPVKTLPNGRKVLAEDIEIMVHSKEKDEVDELIRPYLP
ncbi:MAG: hypothetical protein N4A38_01360 [Candidatus Gracilibacteria bacterium]|nr:hypothetical protein [Candidatus Gracilibacteria bacterium]